MWSGNASLPTSNSPAGLQDELQKLRAEVQLKKDFMAFLCHELRNPLHTVLNNTSFLLDTAVNDEQKGLASAVISSAVFMVNVVNDILQLSKAEAGGFSRNLQPVNVKSLIMDICGSSVSLARAKGLELQADVQLSNDETLLLDSLRLTQIINNLLSNSIKYTNQGGIHIHVTTTPRQVPVVLTDPSNDPLLPEDVSDTDAVNLVVSISDSGAGIAEDRLPRLFEPFHHRENISLSSTGLGLAIIKTLVDLLQGSISVKSTMGQGTEFLFTIPSRRLASKSASPSPSPAATNSGVIPSTSTSTSIPAPIDLPAFATVKRRSDSPHMVEGLCFSSSSSSRPASPSGHVRTPNDQMVEDYLYPSASSNSSNPNSGSGPNSTCSSTTSAGHHHQHHHPANRPTHTKSGSCPSSPSSPLIPLERRTSATMHQNHNSAFPTSTSTATSATTATATATHSPSSFLDMHHRRLSVSTSADQLSSDSLGSSTAASGSSGDSSEMNSPAISAGERSLHPRSSGSGGSGAGEMSPSGSPLVLTGKRVFGICQPSSRVPGERTPPIATRNISPSSTTDNSPLPEALCAASILPPSRPCQEHSMLVSFNETKGCGNNSTLPLDSLSTLNAGIIDAAVTSSSNRFSSSTTTTTTTTSSSLLSHGAKRVLVVDDHDSNRKIASRILRKAGFVVDTAADGQEAFEMWSRAVVGFRFPTSSSSTTTTSTTSTTTTTTTLPASSVATAAAHADPFLMGRDEYSVLLMDIHMPVMDGVAATKKIREAERLILGGTGARPVAIVALSDDLPPDSPFSDSLPKPFDAHQLVQKVRQFCLP